MWSDGVERSRKEVEEVGGVWSEEAGMRWMQEQVWRGMDAAAEERHRSRRLTIKEHCLRRPQATNVSIN